MLFIVFLLQYNNNNGIGWEISFFSLFITAFFNRNYRNKRKSSNKARARPNVVDLISAG